ncbi:phage tail tape measure protein [Streptomyces griseorubiginosus]|uniref:phage tail tape measure protein n=1 Tax=Streptomyces griseorubiginosus TaxID=67304 RepID=UPI0036BFCD05
MSDTSLVFNLVARDRASQTLESVKEKFNSAATGIAAGVGVAMGVGVAQSLDMSAASAKLAAQLGAGPAEAAELSKVSANVYASAWGDSATTVNEAIRGVYQNIGDVSQAKGGLEGITSKALALSETFDQEVGPTTAAVGQMLRTGLAQSADEAFDILTAGLQSGANKADDLLDTITEYGTQWRKFGLDGQTAMGLLSQGLKAGARDADTVADAIKEFSIRAIDGSKTTAQGFQAIGLDAQTMAARIGKGGESASGALDETLDKLRAIHDPVKREAAAVALFGTKAEDLGQALFSLDPSSAVSSLGQVGGAADKAMKTISDSPAKTLERFKREVTTKLAEVAGTFIKFATDNQGVMEPLAYTLGALAGAVMVIKAGMVVWAAAQAAWSAATAIATGVQWLWNAALMASPITWIIIGIVALVAIIVLIATKTTWFQTIWSAVWGFIRAAVQMHVDAIKAVIGWFASLPGLFAGWFGAAKDWAVAKFTALVSWLAGLPGRALAAINNLNVYIGNKAIQAGNALKNAVVDRAVALLSWLGGLGGRAVRAVGNFHSLLYNKGRDVITGLWNGISGMGGWLWSKVTSFVRSNVVDAAKSFLHIGSPSKLMADQIGHWIPAGIAEGAENNAGVVDTAIRNMTDLGQYRPAPASVGMAPFAGTAAASGGRPLTGTLRLVNSSADPFMDWLKERIRVEFGGDVTALNSGR